MGSTTSPERTVGPGFDAVIFDLDGTLVDTMDIHYEAYRVVFEEIGLVLTRERFYANIGGKAAETIPRFLAGRPSSLPVDEIHRRKKAEVRRLLGTFSLRPLEAARLLPLLHGRYPLALASSGARDGIEIMLERLRWRPLFDVVVTGEDVVLGKPAPDIFLLAASRLEVSPERCFVFEDTDAGVAAARTAGMEVFDVRASAAPTAGRERG